MNREARQFLAQSLFSCYLHGCPFRPQLNMYEREGRSLSPAFEPLRLRDVSIQTYGKGPT